MQPGPRAWLRAIGLIAFAIFPEVQVSATTPLDPALDHKSIKIGNDVCEAEITVEPFVHLLGFHFLGAKNHLLNFETPNPVEKGRAIRPYFIVGGKLWYAPEVSDSHKFAMLAGAVQQNGRKVDANLDPDPLSGLQARIVFVLDDHRPLLTITSTIKNSGGTVREASCWWPVSFEPGGKLESVPIPAPTDPAYSYHFWSYGGAASEPACKIDKNLVTLNMDGPLQKPIFKIGFIASEIVLTKPDCVFRLTAVNPPVDPGRKYPHGGSPVMLYCDQRSGFCEAELSGPLVELQPGGETTFIFTIGLEKPAEK